MRIVLLKNENAFVQYQQCVTLQTGIDLQLLSGHLLLLVLFYGDRFEQIESELAQV